MERIAATQWLESHTDEDDRVLVAAELALAPSELAQVPADVVVRSLADGQDAATAAKFDYVVVGDFVTTEPWRPAVYDREKVADFGVNPTHTQPWRDRAPSETIRVFGAPHTRDVTECEPLCG